MLVGIDYGAKLAGTTALAWIEDSKVMLLQSEKKKDADAFILDFTTKYKPSHIFIDAPLSIPPAFLNESSNEYFYRQADKELGAMSPMFIGGLTARAMRLKKILQQNCSEVFEVYPAALNRRVLQSSAYKTDFIEFEKVMSKSLQQFNVSIKQSPTTWHQVDAVLTLLSGLRWQINQHLFFGLKEEGQIVV